jgi:hypothetical protein
MITDQPLKKARSVRKGNAIGDLRDELGVPVVVRPGLLANATVVTVAASGAAQLFAEAAPMAEIAAIQDFVDTHLGNIRKETWTDYDWDSKLISQIPDYVRVYQGADKASSLDYRSDSIEASIAAMKMKLNQYLPPALLKYDDKYMEQKLEAAKRTIEYLKQTMRDVDAAECKQKNEQFADDEDDDYIDPYLDDPMYGDDNDEEEANNPDHAWERRDSNYNKNIDDILAFFEALPFNLVFNAGFHYPGISTLDEEKCYCPCSWKMKVWQTQFHLDGLCKGTSGKKIEYCSDNKFIHHALMSHLEKIGERDDLLGLIHRGIHKYIHLLYTSFNGGLGHKALFKMGDDNYKKVDLYERKKLNDLILELQQKLNVEETKRLETERLLRDMEQQLENLGLQTLNQDKYNEITALTKNFRDLDLEICARNETQSEHVTYYQQELNNIFVSLRSCTTKAQKVTLQLPVNFSLQQEMNRWYQDSFCDVLSLFQDFTMALHVSQFLAEWNIQFHIPEFYTTIVQSTSSKRQANAFKKETQAIDKGGPTAQFISSFWKQVENLTITIDVKGAQRDVPLFEANEGGLVPYQDDFFTEGGSDDEKENNLAVARKWYRAVGRVMIHSIIGSKDKDSQKHFPIPSHVIPKLFRSSILSGCTWVDDREYYPWSEVIVDLHRIVAEKTVEYIIDFNANDVDNIFGEYIPQNFLQNRAVALSAIREGFSIGRVLDVAGNIVKNIPTDFQSDFQFSKKQLEVICDENEFSPIPSYFNSVPLNIIDKIIFSKASISVEDVVQVLRIKFWVHSQSSGTCVPLQMINNQETLFKSMQLVLEECTKEHDDFLVDFLVFFTGFPYLPNNIAPAEDVFPEPTVGQNTSKSMLIVVIIMVLKTVFKLVSGHRKYSVRVDR